MKKLMIAASAALCATVGFSDVTSANIVGYQAHQVAPNSTALFALQFENVGEKKEIPIKQLVTCPDFYGKTANTGLGSDQIWTYKDGAWSKYYYYYKSATNHKWCPIGSTTEITDAKTLSAGDSFFFQRSSSASTTANLTIAGEVKALNLSKAIPVAKGSTTLLANPWPTSIKVKEFSNYCENPYGKTVNTGLGSDQVWMYKNGKWSKYYYYYKSATNKKWCTLNTTTEVTDAVTIEPGDGFFFQRAGEDTNINLKGPEYKAE